MAQHRVTPWGQLFKLSTAAVEPYSARHDRRLGLRYACDVPVTIQTTGPAGSVGLTAQVRDLSRGGLRLRVDQSLDVGTMLHVQMPDREGRSPCILLACVLHTAAEVDGSWVVGCAFMAELTEEDLLPFGGRRQEAGPPDDRVWQRFSCDTSATYRVFRMRERAQANAQVTDLSPRGIGLLVEQPLDVGTVLSLELCGPGGQPRLRLLACIVRRGAQPNGRWTLGCNFIRELSPRELNAMRPTPEPDPVEPPAVQPTTRPL